MSDAMINVLKHYGSPVNREEYLNTAYMGKPPARLDPESEAELPQDDVRFMAHRPTTHEEIKAEEDKKAQSNPEKAAKPKPAKDTSPPQSDWITK